MVRLTPGPVILRQTRLGEHGRPFTIYKFRTMTVAPKGGEQQVWARPDDARVTPIGRVLRKYRLDELPQLFNALLGDMNVVGPRPEQPAIAVRLRREIRGYHRRQRVAPGITGLAQISRGYDRSLEDVRLKLVYDLQYIRRRSVWEDLRIMLRTLPVMLLGRGGW